MENKKILNKDMLNKYLSSNNFSITNKYIMLNSKLVNNLNNIRSCGKNGLKLELNSKSKKSAKNKELSAFCILKSDYISDYDLIVYNAICSILSDNDINSFITVDIIYKVINGCDNKARLHPSEKQKNMILDSIDRLSNAKIFINCTKEVLAYKLTDDEINRLDIKQKKDNDKNNLYCLFDCLLNCEWIDGGKLGNCENIRLLRFASVPVLLRYCQINNQIISIPKNYIKCDIPTTVLNIKIRNYLLERIYLMLGNNHIKQNSIMLIDYYKRGQVSKGLYSIVCDKKTCTKNETLKIRRTIEKYLENFVDKGLINGFEFEVLPDKRIYKSIQIITNPPI